MRCLGLLLLASGTTWAFQLPFQLPFFKSKVDVSELEPAVSSTPRIAIIGAGAGGSSAAFWISKAKERFGVDVEVDVYERESYIGGRSTTVYPYDNESLPSVELGASIFVKANKNMWRASDEFNFTRLDFDEGDGSIGVWDGEKVVFSTRNTWWDNVKMVWRYGLSPKLTQSIVENVIHKFSSLYTREAPKWDDISTLATSLGWTEMITHSTSDYFESHGVSKKFTRQLIEATTRVNYGQNSDGIHALEGACSLAATGASGIKGGNFKIFEQFLERSAAKVYLNTTVTSITQKSTTSHHHWTLTTDKSSDPINYKAVILAAPYHSTNISLPSTIGSDIPEQPYVHLHVTLVTTTAKTFSPSYFGLGASSHVPAMMLTTYEGARQGGKEPEFNSISYHGMIKEGEWIVKIFSKEIVSDEWLQSIFPGEVGWVYRKEWDAYPVLPPTSRFPPVKLATGLYYVNAFEPFISTMETETIASRNVVDLLLNEEFDSSICGRTIGEVEPPASLREAFYQAQEDEHFVIGWDC